MIVVQGSLLAHAAEQFCRPGVRFAIGPQKYSFARIAAEYGRTTTCRAMFRFGLPGAAAACLRRAGGMYLAPAAASRAAVEGGSSGKSSSTSTGGPDEASRSSRELVHRTHIFVTHDIIISDTCNETPVGVASALSRASHARRATPSPGIHTHTHTLRAHECAEAEPQRKHVSMRGWTH